MFVQWYLVLGRATVLHCWVGMLDLNLPIEKNLAVP
jgi:hypothetical protein